MKLSENTLSVLKNFSSINSGVVLQAGKTQKTISPEKSILVEATLEDDIPEQFGIYDLNSFLANVTSAKDPNLEFSKESVTITEDLSNGYRDTFIFGACSPNLIITPPEKELALKQVDVSFNLTNLILQKYLRRASTNNLPHLSIVGKEGDLLVKVHDKSNDTSNQGFVKIGDYAGKDFTASFKTENLKLIPDDYDVELQIGAFAKFANKASNLKYFIALETK